MNKKTTYETKGIKFKYNKSLYVNDAAFLFLTREDLEIGSKIIVIHYTRFGLSVHFGNIIKKDPSKTEAIYFPKPQQKTNANKTKDIILNDNGNCFTFTTIFKYLGTMFTDNFKDDVDIN